MYLIGNVHLWVIKMFNNVLPRHAQGGLYSNIVYDISAQTNPTKRIFFQRRNISRILKYNDTLCCSFLSVGWQ